MKPLTQVGGGIWLQIFCRIVIASDSHDKASERETEPRIAVICIDEMSDSLHLAVSDVSDPSLLSQSLVWPVCYGINSLQWGWPHTSHLTPHNSYLAHDDSYFSSEQYCVTKRTCSEQWGLSSVVESERAYLYWLTDGDYSSTSYQSQGGVMVCGRNSLLRLTVSTSHLTPAPTQLVKQSQTLQELFYQFYATQLE